MIQRFSCMMLTATVCSLLAAFLIGVPARYTWADTPDVPRRDRECCDLSGVPGVVWAGSDPVMTLQKLASYCGPIIWFSPDEPLLSRKRGKSIRLTEHMFFEEDPDAPVLYYRVDDVAVRLDADGDALVNVDGPKADIQIDLSKINAIDVRYCFYYPAEVGLGSHKHDLEVVDVQVLVYQWDEWQDDPCENCKYVMSVVQVIGRAHGLLWYDNHLLVDEWTKFPIGIMVEEGKHANCPDKNLDGMYTPGYDVNQRVNDAWGVRDIMRGGQLFTGGFESWMNKTRLDEDRVFPPLPEDSWVREHFVIEGEYAPDNAIYVLRPLPPKELAEGDAVLQSYIESKGDPDWPYQHLDTEFHQLQGWLQGETFSKSLSIAFRYDGEAGFSFAFPFFVIKHLEAPMLGGWIVQRMYLQGKKLQDFGWTLLYAPSASRWIDGYLSAGVEWDVVDVTDSVGGTREERQHHFVMESGMKFRVNMKYTPMKFLTKLTDFWGFRIGLKYKGNAWDFRNTGLVVEVGAGAF